MKTTSEILAAFKRGELTPVEAEEALNRWDEERVEREVDDLLVSGKRPDLEGSYPAGLWDRYWLIQLSRVSGELMRACWDKGQMLISETRGEPDQRRGVVTLRSVRAWLAARGMGDVEVTIQGGWVLLSAPPLPRPEFGISLRQVER